MSQNLPERAINMFNDGMTKNAVAMNIGRFTRAIRHLKPQSHSTPRLNHVQKVMKIWWTWS